MDTLHVFLGAIGIVIAIVLWLAIVWSVQHRREMRSMSEAQRRNVALASQRYRRDKALFWVPFFTFIALAGAAAGAMGRSGIGFLDAVAAFVLAKVFASVARYVIRRNQEADSSSPEIENAVQPQTRQ